MPITVHQRRPTFEAVQYQPGQWWETHGWQVVARTDWADAYAYAVNTGNTNPGGDPAVVTDGMILAAVQNVRGES